MDRADSMGALMRADAELLAPPNTILLSGLALLSSFLWYKPGLIYTSVYIIEPTQSNIHHQKATPQEADC